MKKYIIGFIFLVSVLEVYTPLLASTWYVRPTGGSYGVADGTSYATAYSGFANITWNSVVAGDTLYVCGSHTTQMLVVGSSGTQANQIVISGACPSDAATINTASLSGNSDCIQLTDKQWTTIQYITISGCKRHGILIYASAITPLRGNIIQYTTIDNRTASHATNTCHGIYYSGVVGAGFYHSYGKILHNTVLGTSATCFSDNNDDINTELVNGPFLIEYNFVSGGHEGIDNSGSGKGDSALGAMLAPDGTSITGMLIRSNYSHNNRGAGIKNHGSSVCPDGLIVSGNILANNAGWGQIFQDATNSFYLNNTVIHNGTFMGLDIESVNGCSPTGNTYQNNLITADYAAGVARIYNISRATFEANNAWNGNLLWQLGAETPLIYFTADTGNNVSIGATFTTWQASHTRDLNSDPLLINTYALSVGSPAYHAGVSLTGCLDYQGSICQSPPNIGAEQSGHGTPTTRSNTTRGLAPARTQR